MILTDQHCYRSPERPAPSGEFFSRDFPRLTCPRRSSDIVDGGREYDGGHPPATIRFAGKDIPNPQADTPPRPIWARAEGVVPGAPEGVPGAVEDLGQFVRHADVARRSAEPAATARAMGRRRLRGASAAAIGAAVTERGEIFDPCATAGITGFAIVAGEGIRSGPGCRQGVAAADRSSRSAWSSSRLDLGPWRRRGGRAQAAQGQPLRAMSSAPVRARTKPEARSTCSCSTA